VSSAFPSPMAPHSAFTSIHELNGAEPARAGRVQKIAVRIIRTAGTGNVGPVAIVIFNYQTLRSRRSFMFTSRFTKAFGFIFLS